MQPSQNTQISREMQYKFFMLLQKARITKQAEQQQKRKG
jgi:hypothetical protein